MMALEEDRLPGGSFWAADDADAVVRRIWRVLPIVIVAMILTTLMVATGRDAAGVAVGAGLAAVNFRFLETGLRSLLGTGRERPPQGTTLMLVLRWAVVGMIGYVVFQSGLASGGGILAGLFAPAIVISLEAVYQAAAALGRQSGGQD